MSKKAIPSPKFGRPAILANRIKDLPKNHIQTFKSRSKAVSFWKTAKRLGRNPTLRTIDNVYFVYLDNKAAK